MSLCDSDRVLSGPTASLPAPSLVLAAALAALCGFLCGFSDRLNQIKQHLIALDPYV